MTPIQTIYLPRQGDAAPEPAPYLMTEQELIRLLRLDSAKRPDKSVRRYREMGLLRAVQVGRYVRYTLTDALAFLENAKRENPR